MNRAKKTMWPLLVLLCLLVLVTGCGKNMVKNNGTTDQFAQSGEQVKTYGQMQSHSTIMKDGVFDGENLQMGESTITPIRVTKQSLVEENPERDGSMNDNSLDVVSMSLVSTDPGNASGLIDGFPEQNGGGLQELDGGRNTEGQLFPKRSAVSREFRDVHFDFDSWRLSDQAREILEANAEWLKVHPYEQVTIEGHCDERGTQSYNYVLGEKRASMVQEYLSFLGVSPEQLHVATFGKDRPACRTMTDDCLEQNRRAHFNARVNMVSHQQYGITR